MRNGNGKILTFDIDNTICTTIGGIANNYTDCIPNEKIIKYINEKYNEGYIINLYTARGTKSHKDFSDITLLQLQVWNVMYDNLYFGKPDSNLYIDDKAINVECLCPNIEYQEKINKNWGTEYLLAKTNQYALKRLEIDPEKSISLQYHKLKHETLHIVQGHGLARIGDIIKEITVGDTLIIPPGVIHQVSAAAGIIPLIVIEGSTSELNDVVHVEEDKNVINS